MASTINSDNGVVSGTSGLKSTADTSGVLALQSNGSTGVTLDTSLNVGIGTASPGYKLDVNGTFGLGTGQTGNIGVFGANTATGDTYFKLRNTAGAFDIGTSATGHYFYGQGSLPLQFFTNATQRFVIGSSGQFGIGASPSYGSSGQVLTSGGSGAAPTWSTPSAGTTMLFAAFSSTGGF